MVANHGVFQDWAVNRGNPRIQLVLASFRLAQKLSRAPALLFPLAAIYLALYRVVVEWLMAIELHWELQAGPRLRIFHAFGLVVNPSSVLGSDCVLRHTTTLGARDRADEPPSGAPILGDRVDVGPHVVILGPVQVGDDAVIGAGAVVIRDVPPRAIVAGNPARVIGEVQSPA